jgi:hypothetical protein
MDVSFCKMARPVSRLCSQIYCRPKNKNVRDTGIQRRKEGVGKAKGVSLRISTESGPKRRSEVGARLNTLGEGAQGHAELRLRFKNRGAGLLKGVLADEVVHDLFSD